MRLLRIEHITEYRFAAPVTLLPHRLLVRPRESHNLRIASSTLDIKPQHDVRWQRDVVDNSIALVTFREQADYLRIGSTVVVEHYEDAPYDFLLESHAVMHPFDYGPDEAALLAPFRELSWPSDRPAVTRWLTGLGFGAGPTETFALLNRLNGIIYTGFASRVREEPGVWSPAQTLASSAGACRDLAALFIDACRCLGLASRFVSGYLHAPVSESGNGSTHAWAEVYLPGPGWKGFDPTAGEVTGNRHIAVAVSRHPEEVPPVSGSFHAPSSLRSSMHVYVRVQPEPQP
jgi:transglutaminase-like putative cysteine protease